jgi:hypothetical protein
MKLTLEQKYLLEFLRRTLGEDQLPYLLRRLLPLLRNP